MYYWYHYQYGKLVFFWNFFFLNNVKGRTYTYTYTANEVFCVSVSIDFEQFMVYFNAIVSSCYVIVK